MGWWSQSCRAAGGPDLGGGRGLEPQPGLGQEQLLLLGGSVLFPFCSSSEFQEGAPDVHPRAREHSVFQAVSCGEEALTCVLGKVERTLGPIYSPVPSSFLSP